jgi:hypothetical protein
MSDILTLTTITISVLQTMLIVVTLFYTRHHFKLERAASLSRASTARAC